MALSVGLILVTIILIAAVYMLYTSYYCSNITYLAGDTNHTMDKDGKTADLLYVSSSDSDSGSSSDDDSEL